MYHEEFVDSTITPWSFSAEFTSVGERLCPLINYRVFSKDTNEQQYKDYAGFTKANDVSKIVTIDDSKFSGSLP
jgi:hypothetical protein